jgi:hypothetical protein
LARPSSQRSPEFGTAVQLLFRSVQAPISMRIGAGQAGAQLTLLAWLGPTSWTTNRQGLFRFGFHGDIMQRYSLKKMFNCDQSFSNFEQPGC